MTVYTYICIYNVYIVIYTYSSKYSKAGDSGRRLHMEEISMLGLLRNPTRDVIFGCSPIHGDSSLGTLFARGGHCKHSTVPAAWLLGDLNDQL